MGGGRSNGGAVKGAVPSSVPSLNCNDTGYQSTQRNNQPAVAVNWREGGASVGDSDVEEGCGAAGEDEEGALLPPPLFATTTTTTSAAADGKGGGKNDDDCQR